MFSSILLTLLVVMLLCASEDELYTFSELLYVSVFKVSSVKEELFIVVSLS
jgi:uncharacterized membrane protein YciS (DUF1049 family)